MSRWLDTVSPQTFGAVCALVTFAVGAALLIGLAWAL